MECGPCFHLKRLRELPGRQGRLDLRIIGTQKVPLPHGLSPTPSPASRVRTLHGRNALPAQRKKSLRPVLHDALPIPRDDLGTYVARAPGTALYHEARRRAHRVRLPSEGLRGGSVACGW